ncbi:MAG: UDP-N-acetylglucosamine 2-epimerase (non-hydrolyzing) [Candidatus Zixiibacteriota bacterium]
MRIKLALIVGARPNFMKAAPLMHELAKFPDKFEPYLIHTGQHYDHNLSQLFFEQLKMPKPDIYLGVGSKSHAEQTGEIMVGLERTFLDIRPDWVIVFGDVNSTMAGAIVAKKIHMNVAHVEAGLRSFDIDMPEEVNRIVTDRISDFLFVSESSGLKHLKDEGVPEDKIYFAGNIMIDSLVSHLELARQSDILKRLSIRTNEFVAMTMHRPANVDDANSLALLLERISDIGRDIPIVFPCHPRTKKQIEQMNDTVTKNIQMTEPLGYLDFLKLQSEAKLVLTDSGGIQEETTYLGVQCVTMRKNTERPVTVDVGTNRIAGINPDNIYAMVKSVLDGNIKKGEIPKLWDGKTAERIVAKLGEL